MTNYEMVELLHQKANVSYEQAKKALEENNWDLLEAMLSLERQGVTIKRSADYSTETQAPENDAAEEEHSHISWRDGIRKIFAGLRKLIVIGSNNSFVISRKGKEIIAFPVIALAILLFPMFWPIVIALAVGLFFGVRYSFRGPNLGKDKINEVMGRATDAAAVVKNEFQNRKEKSASTENTTDEE